MAMDMDTSTALKKAIETIMAVNETQNKDRLSALYFIKYYDLFEEYCNGFDISDVMQTFENTQTALLFCDKNNNFD